MAEMMVKTVTTRARCEKFMWPPWSLGAGVGCPLWNRTAVRSGSKIGEFWKLCWDVVMVLMRFPWRLRDAGDAAGVLGFVWLRGCVAWIE